MRPTNSTIIAWRKSGTGVREIARRLGISPSLVAGVLHRAGLTSEPKGRGLRRAGGNAAPEETKAAVVTAIGEGVTYTEAARAFGVSRSTVQLWVQEARR